MALNVRCLSRWVGDVKTWAIPIVHLSSRSKHFSEWSSGSVVNVNSKSEVAWIGMHKVGMKSWGRRGGRRSERRPHYYRHVTNIYLIARLRECERMRDANLSPCVVFSLAFPLRKFKPESESDLLRSSGPESTSSEVSELSWYNVMITRTAGFRTPVHRMTYQLNVSLWLDLRCKDVQFLSWFGSVKSLGNRP